MNETTDATAILAPLWRYKWLILVVALLVGAGSYVYYRHQPSLYSAVTQIYLGNGAEEQSQLGAGSAGKRAGAPNPITQAALINSSIVREAVHDRLRRERTTTHAVRAALKGKAKAKGSEKSEFITIEGEAHSARGAALLVNTTAQTYIKRQNAHYRAQVETAIALTRRQLRRIEAGQLQSLLAPTSKGNGAAKSSTGAAAAVQTATLSSKINQLEADLGVSLVTQVDPAKPKESVLVSPHPRSNAFFGFAIGLLLACVRSLRARPSGSAAALAASRRRGLPRADPGGAARRQTAIDRCRRARRAGLPAARGAVAIADDDAGRRRRRERPVARARVRSCASARTPVTASRRSSPGSRSPGVSQASGWPSWRRTFAGPSRAGCCT